MPKQRWSVKLTPDAVADKYKVARGEAARLSEALTVLYEGPHPAGFKPYGEDSLGYVYEYTRNGYRIIYEVIAEQLTIRVLFFAPAPVDGR
jgi:mRNA-degrading endonuclease RelE of RelBE toxin-antitoxin system